ncbi:MAG: hypothetical protein ABJG47_14010 [Ekhidna sp.]
MTALILLASISSCNSDDGIDSGDETDKTWIQSSSDFAPEASINQIAISRDGNTIAITDWDPNLKTTGTVKIFRKFVDEWQQIGESLSGIDDDKFGAAISLSADGNIVAVGAPSYNDVTGEVFIYEYTQDTWEPTGQISGAQRFTSLGVDLALNSDGSKIAIISKPLGRLGFNSVLSIYVQSGSNWESVINNFDNVTAVDVPLPSMAFSAEGNRVFLGYTHNTGFVDAYSVNGSALVSIGDRLVGENQLDWFGNIGINTSGSTVAIGGTGYPGADYRGIVKVYQNNSGWEQKGSSLYGEELDDRVGKKVALNEGASRLVVGAGIGISRSAFVRVYDFVEGDWNESLTISSNDIETFDQDLKLSDDGNTLVLLFGRKVEIWSFE